MACELHQHAVVKSWHAPRGPGVTLPRPNWFMQNPDLPEQGEVFDRKHILVN
jgi:hypothetical protein